MVVPCVTFGIRAGVNASMVHESCSTCIIPNCTNSKMLVFMVCRGHCTMETLQSELLKTLLCIGRTA